MVLDGWGFFCRCNSLGGYDAPNLIISAAKEGGNRSDAAQLDERDDLRSVLNCFEIEGHSSIKEAFAKGICLFCHVPTGK